MNRLLIYVHFNKKKGLSDHVIYQLKNIKPFFDKVIFITNSEVSTQDKKRLTGLYDEFIQRENTGFDFAAWRDGIKYIGWKDLEKYDSVTLMNDTCFGPVYPIEKVYREMDRVDIDFWGITDHATAQDGMPGTNGSIPYHIQSYLMVFTNKVVKSKEFRKFWNNVKDYEDINKVIQEYETRLTGVLTGAGFSCGTFFDTLKYSARHNIVDICNYSEFMPIVILKNRVPLVKIKSFLHTSPIAIKREIKKTSYDINLIDEHLTAMDISSKNIKRSYAKSVIKNRASSLARSNVARKTARRFPKVARFGRRMLRPILGAGTTMLGDDIKPGRKAEYLVKEIYNSNLSFNYAEHINLLQDNKVYWYNTESEEHYKRDSNDPRIVAIYLPQFHPFKENNEAWGKGFTEWTNVTASIPRFIGQQQPVLPSDLGFYDLRLADSIKQQIDLAKKYGIYGFQFYYYWFSGKKVMDLPINTVIDNPDWDFNFSICWANENWTKKWDGGDKDIIFEQKDMPGDPLNFIKDVSPILNDSRYITENGHPILTVYRIDLLSDPKRYANIWRKYFKEKYNKELWLVGCTNFKNFKPKDYDFDALMDFTPTGSTSSELKPWVGDEKILNNSFKGKLLDVNWNGLIMDYRYIAKQEVANLKNNINDYKTISPSWSNEARRKGFDGVTFYNSSPEIFTNWLDKILDYEINVSKKKSPLVFINAWNEWAESAMIEPSMHMGHNTLLRIAETVSKYSKNSDNKKLFPPYRFDCHKGAKLAIIVHLFYIDMWERISDKLSSINIPFDLYVSVPHLHSDIHINKINEYHKKTNIIVVPNRGRDVLPFITIMNRIRGLNNYEYVLKLHTKKSKHRKDGQQWFNDVIDTLIPEEDIVDILKTLSNANTGSIGPYGHVVSLSKHVGSNQNSINELLKNITTIDRQKKLLSNKARLPFFGSTMFWCRVDFLDPLLDAYFMPSDFQSEDGQIDGTTAHALERILGKILHKIGNRKMYSVNKKGDIVEINDDIEYDDVYAYTK